MNSILNKKGEIFENQAGSLIFVCYICNGTDYGLAEIEDHLKTHYVPTVKFGVPKPELGLPKESLKDSEHLSRQPPLGCYVCKIDFSDEDTYVLHMINHDTHEEERRDWKAWNN